MSRYRDVVSLFFAKKRRQAIKLGVITFITLNKTGNLFTIINIVLGDCQVPFYLV